MSPTSNFSDLFGEDTPLGNDGDISGPAQPVSEDDIDELLYSEEWTVEQRIARLEALRNDVMQMNAADADASDRNAMLARIDAALSELRGEDGPEFDATAADHDPSAHSETLAPDDDDLLDLEALDETEDEESSEGGLDVVLDETEWDDDGFDPEKGVR